jgi:hypothetical protein
MGYNFASWLSHLEFEYVYLPTSIRSTPASNLSCLSLPERQNLGGQVDIFELGDCTNGSFAFQDS